LQNADITYQEKKTDDISAFSNDDLPSKLARASLHEVEPGNDKKVTE